MPKIIWKGHKLVVHVSQKPNDGLELLIYSPDVPEGDPDPYLFIAEIGYDHCPGIVGLTICFPLFFKIQRLKEVLPIVRQAAKSDPAVAEWLQTAQRGRSGYD